MNENMTSTQNTVIRISAVLEYDSFTLTAGVGTEVDKYGFSPFLPVISYSTPFRDLVVRPNLRLVYRKVPAILSKGLRIRMQTLPGCVRDPKHRVLRSFSNGGGGQCPQTNCPAYISKTPYVR